MYVPSMYFLCIFHFVLLQNSNHCIHIPHLVYSPVAGHLCCFHSLAMMNNDVMDICVQVFCGRLFSFLLGRF